MKIIGLTGFKNSGKTTIARTLSPPFHSFADRVREITAETFGWSVENLKDPELKEKVDPKWGLTRREAMQKVGMAGREKFGKDFWIRQLEQKLDRREQADVVVIDDCRFLNEAEWIRQNGAVIGIDRPGVELDDDHPSEVEMAENWDSMTDYTVRNDRTPADAAGAINNICHSEWGLKL